MATHGDQYPKRRPKPDPFLDSGSVTRVTFSRRQRRIIALMLIALALAAVGGFIGAKLFFQPRLIRTAVSADLKQIEDRVREVVDCLATPHRGKAFVPLAQRIRERALLHPKWPTHLLKCRRAATELVASVNTLAAATPSKKLTSTILARYRDVVLAATTLEVNVTILAEAAAAGHLVPPWGAVADVHRAVIEIRRLLGHIRQRAGLTAGLLEPASDMEPEPPSLPRPHFLLESAVADPRATLARIASHPVGAVILRHGDAGRAPLLVRGIFDEPGVSVLTASLTEASTDGGPARWLDAAPGPNGLRVLWARAAWQGATKRGGLLVGEFGSPAPPVLLAAPEGSVVAPRPVAGLIHRRERLLVARVPDGLLYRLWLYRSWDGGRTYGRATPLPDPLLAVTTEGRVIVRPRPAGGALIVYPRSSAELVVARTSAKSAQLPAVRRTVIELDRRSWSLAPRGMCRAGPRRLYLLGSGGQVWGSDDDGTNFFRLRPASRTGRVIELACAGGRAALLLRDDARLRYATCGRRTCTAPVVVSWSRIERAELVAGTDGVLIVSAGEKVLFTRLDPKTRGKPEPAAPVTRWSTPPRNWMMLRRAGTGQLALLVRRERLKVLYSEDFGAGWIAGVDQRTK